MNFPEKLIGAYLWLNGFFLLPQFTIFEQSHHTHVDFLALRPPNGVESIATEGELQPLPLDEEFFAILSKVTQEDSHSLLLGAVVEVRGNRNFDFPETADLAYAARFFGDEVCLIPMGFALGLDGVAPYEDGISVAVEHAANWVVRRFRWMDENLRRLRKEDSWSMSDDILGDLIYVSKLFPPDFADKRC